MFAVFEMAQSACKSAACQDCSAQLCHQGAVLQFRQPHSAPERLAGSDMDETESMWWLRCTKRSVSSEMSEGER